MFRNDRFIGPGFQRPVGLSPGRAKHPVRAPNLQFRVCGEMGILAVDHRYTGTTGLGEQFSDGRPDRSGCLGSELAGREINDHIDH